MALTIGRIVQTIALATVTTITPMAGQALLAGRAKRIKGSRSGQASFLSLSVPPFADTI